MATAAYNSSVLLTAQPSISFVNEATTDAGDHMTYTITNQAHRYLDKGTVPIIQTSPDGTTWTTVAVGFTLKYVGAIVVFTVANAVGTQVRISNGKYFAYTTLVESAGAEFAAKMTMEDVSVFNSTGTHTFLPTLREGMLKVKTWMMGINRANNLTNRDLLVVAYVTPSGNRYEGYCYVSDTSLKSEVKGAVSEDVTFQLTDQFYAN